MSLQPERGGPINYLSDPLNSFPPFLEAQKISSREKVEDAFTAIAQILLLAGAITMLYNNPESWKRKIIGVDSWGVLIPTALLTISLGSSLANKYSPSHRS